MSTAEASSVPVPIAPRALLRVEALSSERHPAAVYLSSLGSSSRRTMRQALGVIANLVSGGRADIRSLAWEKLRYQHTQAIRSQLAERYAPATTNRFLAALKGCLKECWRLGLMNAENFYRSVDLKASGPLRWQARGGGEDELTGVRPGLVGSLPKQGMQRVDMLPQIAGPGSGDARPERSSLTASRPKPKEGAMAASTRIVGGISGIDITGPISVSDDSATGCEVAGIPRDRSGADGGSLDHTGALTPLAHGARQNHVSRQWLKVAVLLAAPLLLFLAAADAGARGGQQWFSAWTVSHGARLTTPVLTGSSVRMIVRPTISGNAVRVKLENTLGQSPVVFSAAYIGQLQAGAAVVPGSNTQLTFTGSPGLSLAPGAGAWSDPVNFHVRAFERYVISLDVSSASDISAHTLGLVTNYMAAGAHAADPSADGFVPVPNLDPVIPVSNPAFPFYWVAAVDVKAPSTTGTIVAFGDSITDGRCSTRTNNGAASGVVLPDLYNRWADLLAQRLADLPANQSKAVANEGIAGNRIVSGGAGPTALVRMDRDVLEREGATHVIFFEGTNDITGGATAATVIAGSQQIIDRAHAAGLAITGVTVIPRGSATGWTNFMEQQRLAVNDWIRNVANFDGIIDFAALMSGPIVAANNSEEIRPDFSCFDGVHPNPAGYEAMGNFIELSLFKNIGSWNNGHGH